MLACDVVIDRSMRTAVVTGAGSKSGLGFEIGRQLATLGFQVTLTSRDRDAATECARDLDGIGEVLELRNPFSIDAFARRVESRCSSLDILVNNASAPPLYFDKPSEVRIERAVTDLDTIIGGTWRVTNALLPLLQKSACGRIVNVACALGSHEDRVLGLASSWPAAPAFAVAQAGLAALTQLFASELASSTNILVNAVCPGFVATTPERALLGARSLGEGARGVVWAATLPSSGPTGGLFRDGRRLPW